ncbi:hypothetical protein AB0L05_36055 [Nonomuraea pusilla]|uniref:hypothetical protein n=1 Tax=Nonomuraea pusilla TaxID=46177 RepID=UPI0033256A62
MRDAASAPEGVEVAAAALSLRDAAADLTPVYGEPITYQPLSPDDVRGAMLGSGAPE